MSELLDAVKAALRGEPERDATGVFTARFVFTASFPAFRGHFPGDPVLPGIVQLMAGACLAGICLTGEWPGHAPEIAAVKNVKFTAPVRPGDVLTLRARPLPGPASSPQGTEPLAGAEVRALIGETPAASFTLIFGDAHA